MRALVLEHLHSNPVGVYGDVLLGRGIEVHRVRLHLGEALPDWREYDLLVVMGGGMRVYEEDAYPCLVAEKRAIREAIAMGCPYFGVCLGSQLLASALGSRAFHGRGPEMVVNPVFLCEAGRCDPGFRAFPLDVEVFEWHSDTFDLPDGAVRLARSSRYESQAFHVGPTAYAIQCHLETSLDDVRDWFDAWPSLGETFEARYGRGSLADFLEDYGRSMPRLQQTARQLFRRWLENAFAHGRPASAASDAGIATVADKRLFDRAREQERMSRLLDEARAGRGGAIVICGEIGIGKTALLEAAAEQADGMRVLRVSGVEDVSERRTRGSRNCAGRSLAGSATSRTLFAKRCRQPSASVLLSAPIGWPRSAARCGCSPKRRRKTHSSFASTTRTYSMRPRSRRWRSSWNGSERMGSRCWSRQAAIGEGSARPKSWTFSPSTEPPR